MMRSLVYAFVFVAQVCALLTPAQAGEKFAFLVAVNDYDERQLKPLQYARQDITDLSNAPWASGSSLMSSAEYSRYNVDLMSNSPVPCRDGRSAGGLAFSWSWL